jgi:hypothetical protein
MVKRYIIQSMNLKSLRQEEARLTDLYRTTENQKEKKNVELVLEETRDKFQDTIKRFNELQNEALQSCR